MAVLAVDAATAARCRPALAIRESAEDCEDCGEPIPQARRQEAVEASQDQFVGVIGKVSHG
ncbi:hypothetical protein IGA89_33320, partial [Pseudomonas aeruginosa]